MIGSARYALLSPLFATVHCVFTYNNNYNNNDKKTFNCYKERFLEKLYISI